MNNCKYHYFNGEDCTEYCYLGDFCQKHENTYQSRNYKRVLTVGKLTIILIKNEAISLLSGTKILPLSQKEIIFLEGKGIKINKSIRDLVFQSDTSDVSLGDTFLQI